MAKSSQKCDEVLNGIHCTRPLNHGGTHWSPELATGAELGIGAKSSAAPVQLNFRNLRRELIDEIAAMSDDPTLHSENFHEQAGQLIADHAKTYARAAHQALYEALSAAAEYLPERGDDGWVEGAYIAGENARAALALADAAQGEK